MGWFGNNDKDDLKKHSEKIAKDTEEDIEEEEESEEDSEEEGDGDDEEEEDKEEPEKECAFQYNWGTDNDDNETWDCGLTDGNVSCDKTKCPFWKK
jgi:hypothetical protein